jgi:hypothetical protein
VGGVFVLGGGGGGVGAEAGGSLFAPLPLPLFPTPSSPMRVDSIELHSPAGPPHGSSW